MLLGQTTFEIVAISVGLGATAVTIFGSIGSFIWWFAKLHLAVKQTGGAVSSVAANMKETISSVAADVKEIRLDVKTLTSSQQAEREARQSHSLVCDVERENMENRISVLEKEKIK